MAKPRTRPKKDDLNSISASLSASCKKSIRALQARSEKIESILAEHLKVAETDIKQLKPGLVQSMSISGAVALDKQFDALRAVRDLEMTAGDTIEATFIIIEEDPRTGVRRVVGVPPELADVVPLG